MPTMNKPFPESEANMNVSYPVAVAHMGGPRKQAWLRTVGLVAQLIALAIYLGVALWPRTGHSVIAETVTGQTSLKSEVNEFYGVFTATYPIEVPDFRELTPNVSLVYSSASRNGFVGVGWNLDAGSMITRMGANGGAPRFDATDIYSQDGTELVASTTMGGTHCTKIQNYTRIQYDAVTNKWSVKGTTGAKATYEPILNLLKNGQSNTVKWGLKSTVDTRGNTVSFTWSCTVTDCYIQQDNVHRRSEK